MRSIKISRVECLHLVIAGLLIACYCMTMSLQKSLAIFGLWSLVKSKYYAIFKSGFCNHCKMLSYLVDFWSSFLPSTNASSEKKRHLYKTTTIIKFSDDSFFHFVTNLTHIVWTVHYFYTFSQWRVQLWTKQTWSAGGTTWKVQNLLNTQFCAHKLNLILVILTVVTSNIDISSNHSSVWINQNRKTEKHYWRTWLTQPRAKPPFC